MYTDIGTRIMGSTASPTVPQSVAAATAAAGLLSEHWIDLLEGIRAQDTLARSLGEGQDLIANFVAIASLGAATANVTVNLMIVALPRTSLAALAVVAANTTETFTAADHGLENGTALTVGGTQPTGIAASTHYFVVNRTANTFQLSASPGGAVVAFSTDGTSVTVTLVPQVIGSSGSIPLKRLAAGDSKPVRLNPLGTSKQQPRHRYIFGFVQPSADLNAGTMTCDITQDSSNERLYYPPGQIA